MNKDISPRLCRFAFQHAPCYIYDRKKIEEKCRLLTTSIPQAAFYIETGRFPVCNAGCYFTPIVDVKESRGRKYLIVQNGMNGFLRPAIDALLQANAAGDLPVQEPLFTSKNEFSVTVLTKEEQMEQVDVVGNLCTGLDVIAKDVMLPRAVPGDILMLTNAGSYAWSLSPLLFSGHEPPGQYLWEA